MKNKNLLYRHDKPNEPTEGRIPFIFFVFFESPFTSVSTVCRGYPSLASLGEPKNRWLWVALFETDGIGAKRSIGYTVEEGSHM
jgi:hypothetical protein